MEEAPAEEDFIARWAAAGGSERANYQLFVTDLCRVLDLPQPEPAREDTRDNAYVFDDTHAEATPTAARMAFAAPVARQPWPTGLHEQIKAVAELLSASPAPLALADIEARFSARGRWRDRLPTILDTLEALGRARRPQPGVERWQTA